MRRGARALGAAVLLAGVTRCAGGPSPASPAPKPTPIPAPAFIELADADAALLAVEDRRAFDAPVLAAAAGSSNPRIRARAALTLGRLGDERAVPGLARLLADPAAPVRESAAFAAGILGEPSMTAALVPLVSDPEFSVASRAAWSLGLLEQESAQDALIQAIPSAPTAELRAALLRALWHFPTAPAAAAATPFASNPDPKVRAAALYALARRPQEPSRALLTAGLRDSNPDSAIVCGRALGILGRIESLEPLSAAMFAARPSVVVQALSAARAILEKDGSAALAPPLAARLLSLAGDVDPNLAVPAIALLRWFPSDRDVFRRLWTVASTGRGRRQQVALQALMGALREGSESLVDAAMAGADPDLRGAAAEALSFLPAPDAAARREKLAVDPEVVVRLKVLDGLKTGEDVGNQRALVERLLQDSDAGVRAAAIDALATTEDPSMIRVLHDATVASYGDREPDVAIAAIAAARKLSASPAARPLAEAAYHHPSALVSRLARRALVVDLHADPAEFPLREYSPGKGLADYAALAAQARLRWDVRVETERGAWTIRLFGDEAPLTTMNFLRLARQAFFDGVRIHRVVPGYVVQDGDPTGTGNGGPGYEIRDELNAIPYGTGTVGMALSGPDTGGSQWFVTQGPQPHLEGNYTAFGQVVEGLDVVNRIEQGDRILKVRPLQGRVR